MRARILHQRHHSRRRQPARARRRSSDFTTRTAFGREHPNNTSRQSRLKPRPSRLHGFCPDGILQPQLRPLAQGLGYCGLRARIDSPTHQFTATMVPKQHPHPFRKGPRRRRGLRRISQAGRGSLSRQHRNFARSRRQAQLALRLQNHE